jgi:uncharacterized Ntn-hydrolase superfamily protein
MRRFAACVLVALTAMALVGAGSAQATWSIVGVDEATGEVGVAVASCVGFEVTVVPVLVPGIGAAASQADISGESGERIVAAMEPGVSAQDVIDATVVADDRPDDRQFGAVVIGGGGAGWSGADTFAVAIDQRNADSTASAQGNILVAAAVVDDALAAFDSTDGELADRLLAGLLAGADAGGDSRCDEQTATAAALIVADPDDPLWSHTDAGPLGVDPADAPTPSVFVSVLVERGGERAPDRLVDEWVTADRDGSSILIRQIDEGADTAAARARTIVTIGLAIVALGAIALIVFAAVALRRWRARRSDD